MMADVARREVDADAVAAVSRIPAAMGAFGLATASLTINLAATREPPPCFGDSTYYRLALVGSFLAGVAQVAAAVWVVDDPRSRRAIAKKIIYASIAPLVVAVGLTGAVLLLW